MSQSFLEGENVSMHTARARSSSSRTPSPEVMQSMPIDSSARPLLQHDGYDIVPELPRQRSSSRTPSPEGNSGPSDAGNRRSVAFFDESITIVQAGQRFDASSRTPSPEVIAAASRLRRQSIVNISPPNLEATINCRTVRWSENLICPSPMLPSRRRKGWYNKRGDQLWTNDGHFAPAEPGIEYPPDLDEYPDFGVGWMKEDGTRIDMEHRLIPKVPLRSALKKTCAREVLQTARPRSEVRFVGP
ncbi:hypothetical protein BD410DRAFT_771069 [Rickenella mellea]|uniref:Uncharacterized protein n=1 Tax=Rickenella mellea TaxID=50990 RepID=A0A4Y7Q325_9AGAM|nr:hypothetical protein BD410DRAFT_771069 [Rickenella mellea]